MKIPWPLPILAVGDRYAEDICPLDVWMYIAGFTRAAPTPWSLRDYVRAGQTCRTFYHIFIEQFVHPVLADMQAIAQQPPTYFGLEFILPFLSTHHFIKRTIEAISNAPDTSYRVDFFTPLQSGQTTTLALLSLCYALHSPDRHIMVIASEWKESKARVHALLHKSGGLPFLEDRFDRGNHCLSLKNNSRIYFYAHHDAIYAWTREKGRHLILEDEPPDLFDDGEDWSQHGFRICFRSKITSFCDCLTSVYDTPWNYDGSPWTLWKNTRPSTCSACNLNHYTLATWDYMLSDNNRLHGRLDALEARSYLMREEIREKMDALEAKMTEKIDAKIDAFVAEMREQIDPLEAELPNH